jgi:hypothetical protein
MNILTMYDSALQVAAAFLIFVVGYIVLLFAVVFCLLIVEGLRQAFIRARISFLGSGSSNMELPLTPAPAIVANSAFSGRSHRLTGTLTGLRDRYFHSLS